MQRSTIGRLRRVELLLWIMGVLCAGYVGLVGIQAHAARANSFAIVRSTAASREPGSPNHDADHPGSNDGRVIGRLSIPDLALSVPVMSDFDTNSLLRGVGHIQGTALPGGLGTMGLAGHRDTYFRPLRRIKLGMAIEITGETGTYHYSVDSTEIVTPDEVQVLNIQDRPEMTLITCYPFDFVGAAPRRFIVHAHLLSASPDGTKSDLR